MTYKLNDDDKRLISVVNEQVNLLLDKSAADTTIINTLIDFIPDVKCLMNGDNDKELALYCSEYAGDSSLCPKAWRSTAKAEKDRVDQNHSETGGKLRLFRHRFGGRLLPERMPMETRLFQERP